MLMKKISISSSSFILSKHPIWNDLSSNFNLNRIKKLFFKFKILEIYRVDKVKDNKILNARYSIIFKK